MALQFVSIAYLYYTRDCAIENWVVRNIKSF
jgi:hypothetical protein